MLNVNYEGICEKLGFDPLADPENLPEGDDWFLNDEEIDRYVELNNEEIDLLIEIAIAARKIKQAYEQLDV